MKKASKIAHVIVPSNVIVMMTGCRQVSKSGEFVTAHYSDGTEDRIHWPEYNIYEKKDDFFSLLGDIQARARRERQL